jgi:hypothetical protein
MTLNALDQLAASTDRLALPRNHSPTKVRLRSFQQFLQVLQKEEQVHPIDRAYTAARIECETWLGITLVEVFG